MAASLRMILAKHVTGPRTPARKLVLHCAKVRHRRASQHFLAHHPANGKFTVYSTA
jgi:hypothetical protein